MTRKELTDMLKWHRVSQIARLFAPAVLKSANREIACRILRGALFVF